MLWSNVGDTETEFDLLDAATGDYERALRRDPLSVRALDRLGYLAVARGDARAAVRWFRASLAVEPNQTSVRRELVRLG